MSCAEEPEIVLRQFLCLVYKTSNGDMTGLIIALDDNDNVRTIKVLTTVAHNPNRSTDVLQVQYE